MKVCCDVQRHKYPSPKHVDTLLISGTIRRHTDKRLFVFMDSCQVFTSNNCPTAQTETGALVKEPVYAAIFRLQVRVLPNSLGNQIGGGVWWTPCPCWTML